VLTLLQFSFEILPGSRPHS